MVLVLETGHVEVQVLDAFLKVGQCLFEGGDFLIIQLIVGLEVSFEPVDDGLVLCNFRPKVFIFSFLLFETIVEVEQQLVVVLALCLLLVVEVAHLVLQQLDVSVQLQLLELVLVGLVFAVAQQSHVLLLQESVQLHHLPKTALRLLQFLQQP